MEQEKLLKELKLKTEKLFVKPKIEYNKGLRDYLDEIINYFVVENQIHMTRFEKGDITKEEFSKIIFERIENYELKKEEKVNLFKDVENFLWSYDILNDLIENEDVSDIKLVSPTNINIKVKGKRQVSTVKFRSEAHYSNFIQRVLTRNKVNLSRINAIQKFVDITSNDKFRLRFNITASLINSNGFTSMQIRKIPKFKRTYEELINSGLFTLKQIIFLIKAVEDGKSIFLSGSGGSGKTTLINFLIDYIPRDNSILCIQENDEVFSDYHTDMLCQNVFENKKENLDYTLKDLARNGLLLDIDWFIIGEVKGEEARYLFDALCTGAKGMTSLHSSSARETLVRLSDLVKRGSDYPHSEIIKIFSTNVDYIVFLSEFKIEEILSVDGWDEEKETVKYKTVNAEEVEYDSL